MTKEKEETKATGTTTIGSDIEKVLTGEAKDKSGNVIGEFNYYKWSLDREGLDKALTRHDIKKFMGMVNSIEKTLKRNAAARPESAPSSIKEARNTLKVLEKDLKAEMEAEMEAITKKYAGLVKATA
jgi:hypothetical protein